MWQTQPDEPGWKEATSSKEALREYKAASSKEASNNKSQPPTETGSKPSGVGNGTDVIAADPLPFTYLLHDVV